MTHAQAHQMARHATQTASEPDQKKVFHQRISFQHYLYIAKIVGRWLRSGTFRAHSFTGRVRTNSSVHVRFAATQSRVEGRQVRTSSSKSRPLR